MNESTQYTPTSRLARESHFWGVLALILLFLSGLCIVGLAAGVRGPNLQAQTPAEVNTLFLGAVLCQGLAVLAALVAFVLGIRALGNIRRGAGRVKGTGLAISGLVTATLTVLPLVLGYGGVALVTIVLAMEAPKIESSNNLKVLGIAMHLYHENYRRFPPAVLRDPSLGERGQPYSWRVALLPFLGERELFSQYRRDEPWDSPANKAVLDRMPRVFAAPGDVRAADGFTHYQVLVGPGTAFERPDLRLSLGGFPRGASETILVVEAADPVPWTKPVDLPYAPNGPMPKVGGLVGDGFHALFANGSVRWFDAEEQESKLRTLVPLNSR
jgi:hypothetical protein